MTARRRAPKRPPREPRRLRALGLIAAGKSSTEVAAELGVNRSSVNRWRSDPDFDEQLRQLQAEQTDAVHALLVAESLRVGRSIVAMATGDQCADMARVKACQVYFELLGRHKNAPITPAERLGEIETAEDVAEALKDIPTALLQRVIDGRDGTPTPGRSKAREL